MKNQQKNRKALGFPVRLDSQVSSRHKAGLLFEERLKKQQLPLSLQIDHWCRVDGRLPRPGSA